MRNIKKVQIFIACSIVLLAFNSCLKNKYNLNEVNTTNWEPSLAIPLLNTDLTVYNVLQKIDDNHVVADADGFISLVYDGDLVLDNLDSIVKVPSQNLDYTYTILGGDPILVPFAAVPIGSTFPIPTVTQTFNFDIAPASVDLYKIDFSGGEIALNLTNNFQQDIVLTVTIPNLVKGGSSFSESVSATQMTNSAEMIFNITGYTFTMDPTNQFDMDFDVVVTKQNADGTGDLHLTIDMRNLKYSLIEANLAQRVVKMVEQEDVLLKIFEDAQSGVFQLLNPEVRIDITNSVGVPIEFNFDNNLIINSTVNGTQEALAFISPADALVTVGAPASATADPVTTNLVFNNTNVVAESLNKLTNSTPKFFTMVPEFTVNPVTTPTPAAPNFITDSSKIHIHGEVELPMEGYAYDYVVEDTVAFPGLNLTNEEVTNVLFKTGVDNGFPIDLKFQLTFLDSNYTILDSLYSEFDDNLMESAIVGTDGKVTSSTLKIKEVEYDKTRVSALSDARYLLLRAAAASDGANSTLGSSSKVVKLYDWYKVNVRLSMKLDLSVTP